MRRYGKEQDKRFSRRSSEKEIMMARSCHYEVCVPKQPPQWEVAGLKRRPGRPRINWRVNKDLQRMGLTWDWGRSQRGDMGECSPHHGLKKIFSP